MKRVGALLVAICLTTLPSLWAQPGVLERGSALELAGQFRAAQQLLTNALASSVSSEPQRAQLRFELDRLERIRKDYSYSQAELFAALKKSVRGLSEKEFERWITEGRFDVREIDGEQRFMGSSVSNLFFRYPELNPRRIPVKDTTHHDRASWETCVAIKAAAQREKRPYVLPKQFEAEMTVSVEADAVPEGEVIRAWLPIPRRYPFQNEFSLLKTSSPIKHIDDESSPIRAIELEQPAIKGAPTKFSIAYDYTVYGVWFDIRPEVVTRADANNPALKPFLAEAPHIVFTPELRTLSKRIAGSETNPALKAKKFYDWIASNIKYSYALEYSTIPNLSEYCLTKGYGDCGQEALLFMALCRLNQIPARWQSGWNTFPGAKSIHDWCEIYLDPYGWVPVDPYKGIWAMQYATTLTPAQQREARDFYFGGLDYYRMAANSDHNQTLTPAKKSFRSDNVDFQRGELEWSTNNIYFDQYSYELNVKEREAR